MFSEEYFNYITHGREETNIEYKESMDWNDNRTRWTIVRAMLAMANHKGGGVIVVGVKEISKTDYEIEGMTDDHFNGFNFDYVSTVVRNYCDPVVIFSLFADECFVDGQSKKFIVIQIRESLEPTICIRLELNNKSVKAFPDNIALRQNAIYIRSKSPIESREIATVQEWRDLINRLVEKNQEDLIKRIPWPQLAEKVAISSATDQEKFDAELLHDEL